MKLKGSALTFQKTENLYGVDMKINLPVTDEEYRLEPNAIIVSETDVKGIITYVNSSFIIASGRSADECIGQPHNISRHPDMPVEGFEDLWNTLAKEQSWTGVVKNRRKDGGFYWCRSKIFPLYDSNGIVVGYRAIRVPATAREIEEASALYASLNSARR